MRIFLLKNHIGVGNVLPKVKLLAFLFFSLFVSTSLIAQKTAYKDRGNRKEGIKQKSISAKPLSLIGFHIGSEIPIYEKDKDQEYFVKYYSPKQATLSIHARETEGKVVYRMDSNPIQPKKGISKFSPWPVDEVLSKIDLPANELGVVINQDEKDSFIYPAYVSINDQSPEIKGYRLIFFPLSELSYVKYEVFKGNYYGKELDWNNCLVEVDWQDEVKPTAEKFVIDLNIEELGISKSWEGWLTFQIQGKKTINNKKVKKKYYFYHKPKL